MFRAVIFDFFGTLTCAVRRGAAHEQIARALGCTPGDFTRELDATFMTRAVGGLGDPVTALAHVAERAGACPSPGRLRQAAADRIAAVAADIRLRPDAMAVLRRIRQLGMATALISDCGPELPEILPSLPIAPMLDAAVLSIEVGRHKPDPRMYHEACLRLRVRPWDCLYVGDGGSHELSGAAAVGMTAVRLNASDLGGHLVFGSDSAWSGPQIERLDELLPPTRPALCAA